MRLEGNDDLVIELNVTGYQFPNGYDLPSGRHVEPDWLNVEGHVVVESRAWTWAFPCLYSDEAIELGSWLGAIARQQPTPTRVEFTEPNISIDLMEVGPQGATLRWRFAQEACPPGESDDVRLGDGFAVEASFELDTLAAGAASWLHQIAAFPARDGSGE